MNQKSYLEIESRKCTGCRCCELACSLRKTGENNPLRSRIRVHKDILENEFTATFCHQCKEAPCKDVCPVDAISVSDEGIVHIDREACIECKACVQACPFGAMFVDSVVDEVINCDLCKGNPGCVEVCPTGALRFVTGEKMGEEKRNSFARQSIKYEGMGEEMRTSRARKMISTPSK